MFKFTKGKSLLHHNEGQSTVEFTLTMIFVLGFVLFYLQLSLIMAFGNFVHYATFMAARAYLSAGVDKGDQQERASLVIKRTLKKSEGVSGIDRFPSVAKGVGQGNPAGTAIGQDSAYETGNPDYSWLQGVRYTFKSRLVLYPFMRNNSPDGSLTFTSESWLGREPTEADCRVLLDQKGDPSKPGAVITDNGC